jgi:uncharacterized protein YjgD (DUF1641 family)
MSTLTASPILVPAPPLATPVDAATGGTPPAEADAKLDRVLRLLDEQEQRRADLAEAVADLMPMANGLARMAIARLDAMERSGALAVLAEAGRAAEAAAAEIDPGDVRRLGMAAPAATHLLADLAAPEVLALAARAAEALRRPAPPVRLIGLLRALREPEVARGLGVAVALLRALGAADPSIENTTPAPAAG